MKRIRLKYLNCLKCGHKWTPRTSDVRICPKCKSAYWDLPKKDAGQGIKRQKD